MTAVFFSSLVCLMSLPAPKALARPFRSYKNIYIFIHQNMIERTEQKVQQKSTHKKEKKTTIEQVTQIYT